mgnify:CR=1 FL=1|jgi:hypothetical protein|tara:strand:+ start:840 stop:1082 length:243 start_codon:yes stop_codon:yes gene_type:complete
MVRYINDIHRPTDINVRTYTGDGSTTNFTVTESLTDNKVMAYIDGVYQDPNNDYSIGGTSLQFDAAPGASSVVVLVEMPV